MSFLWNNIGRQQGRTQRRGTSNTITTCNGIINNVIIPTVTRSISAATATSSSNRIFCNPLIFQQRQQRKSFSSSAGRSSSSSTVDDKNSFIINNKLNNQQKPKRNQLPVVVPRHSTQIQLRRLQSIHYIPRSGRSGKNPNNNDPEGRDGVNKRTKRTSPNRDVNFDIDLWNKHKSPYRHLRHWIQIYKSSQLQRLIFPDLTIVFSLGCGLTYYNEIIVNGNIDNQIYLAQSYGTIGAAIALLTGFRTSASYGRYQEARTMWGEITNASRDLARQIMMFITSSSSSSNNNNTSSTTSDTNTNKKRRRLLRLVKSYPIALNFYLTTKGGHPKLSRKSKNFTKQRYIEFETELLDIAYNDLNLDLDLDLDQQQQQQQEKDGNDDNDDDNGIIVKDKDLIRILNSFQNGSHTPIVVLTCLSEAIMDCDDERNNNNNNNIDPMFIRTMDIQISRLVGSNGERILRTPIPTGFTRHTSLLLGFFCYMSPFAIYTFFGIYTPFCSCLVSYSLLAIEDIGVTLEEPFHVLPLRQYSDGIADTVDEIANTYSYDDYDDNNNKNDDDDGK